MAAQGFERRLQHLDGVLGLRVFGAHGRELVPHGGGADLQLRRRVGDLEATEGGGVDDRDFNWILFE